MVLRSGIIIPFQFRDSKKLLMIGVPEENRNLNIWDLRNVVRAAFGIYNFEFRNKKIGFNIPDELLLHYLAQRHDLTNFVIEIGQANLNDVQDNGIADSSSAENFVPTDFSLQLNENIHLGEARGIQYGDPFDGKHTKYTEVVPNSDGRKVFGSASETLNKETAYQGYSDPSERSKLSVITDEQTITKCEPSDCEIEKTRTLKKQLFEIDHVQDPQNQEFQLCDTGHPFENRANADIPFKKISYQQHQFASCSMNRFRRRGERMSKDQKEMYVKYFEENPCMQSQRRNDSLLESHWNKLVYDPCKENFTSIGSCSTCRCSAAQKSSLELHDNADTPIYHTTVGGRSNASGTSSQNSQNADEIPTMKVRMQHSNIPASDISHMEIEPKIDYDSTINTTGSNTEVDGSSPPPLPVHAKSSVYIDEEHHQQQQQELHLERLQHEYALQHHQQQQHFETLMQENTTGNSFRQRKERMSKKQKEIYVNFMEQNPVINEHRRSDPILDQYWVKLADILNSVPQGAVKHVAEWKQTFDNWRYRVFLYARYNSKITGTDALNPKSFKPFTQTDKRAYHFWIRNPDTAPPDLEKMRNVFVNLEDTQQE